MVLVVWFILWLMVHAGWLAVTILIRLAERLMGWLVRRIVSWLLFIQLLLTMVVSAVVDMSITCVCASVSVCMCNLTHKFMSIYVDVVFGKTGPGT